VRRFHYCSDFILIAEGKNSFVIQTKAKPFYDGLKFHRVISDFMIQTVTQQERAQAELSIRLKTNFYLT
jgi:peptidylprolyl isomerase